MIFMWVKGVVCGILEGSAKKERLNKINKSKC